MNSPSLFDNFIIPRIFTGIGMLVSFYKDVSVITDVIRHDWWRHCYHRRTNFSINDGIRCDFWRSQIPMPLTVTVLTQAIDTTVGAHQCRMHLSPRLPSTITSGFWNYFQRLRYHLDPFLPPYSQRRVRPICNTVSAIFWARLLSLQQVRRHWLFIFSVSIIGAIISTFVEFTIESIGVIGIVF